MEIVIRILVLNFVWFCVSLSISAQERNTITSCIKIKNITVAPDIDIHTGGLEWQLELEQLGILIKALLRDSCTEVWMYSRIHKRSIRMMESNFKHFLDTEIAVSKFIDENEFVKFATKLPEVNTTSEQTILYRYSYSRFAGTPIKKSLLISKVLKNLQNDKKFNIIVLSTELGPAQELSIIKWIQYNRCLKFRIKNTLKKSFIEH